MNVSMGVRILYLNSCILCESLNKLFKHLLFNKVFNNLTTVHRFGKSTNMEMTFLEKWKFTDHSQEFLHSFSLSSLNLRERL